MLPYFLLASSGFGRRLPSRTYCLLNSPFASLITLYDGTPQYKPSGVSSLLWSK